MRSHRTLLWSVLLSALVVAAAGISGTIHFAGPRWVPDWKIAGHAQTPRKPLAPSATTALRIPSRHGASSFPAGRVVIWIIIGLAAMGVVMVLWRWWVGRPSRGVMSRRTVVAAATSQLPTEPEPDTPALRTGIELALEMLDEQREPADAVVRAWLGLQEAGEESGIMRQPAETPTEFTSRILSRAFADDRPVRTLLRLYLRTRFGDHPVTTDDVAAVRAALQELLRTWPTPDSSAAVAPR
jgi:Domain of unknown function (DUF4129)